MQITQKELNRIKSITKSLIKNNNFNAEEDEIYNELLVKYLEYKSEYPDKNLNNQDMYYFLYSHGKRFFNCNKWPITIPTHMTKSGIIFSNAETKYQFLPYDTVTVAIQDLNFEIIERDITNKDILEKAFEVLKPREIEVLSYRYGLNGKDVHTLEATAKIYGVTSGRIFQIEQKAIRKMNLHLRWVLNNPGNIKRICAFNSGKKCYNIYCKYFNTCTRKDNK